MSQSPRLRPQKANVLALQSQGSYACNVAFDRITIDPKVMAGVPCIKGTRIPVATVVGMVAEDMSVEEILSEFPQLSGEDIREALRYASARVDEREVELRLGA